MKARLILILSLAVSLLVLVSCGPGEQRPTWAEEFNGDSFDTTVWAKIPRGPSPWDWHMASNDELFEVKDGCLTLRAIVNPDTTVDKAPLLTGGLITRMPLCFGYGKLEICARLAGARSAWPAIWMLPFDNAPWPAGGEIDIIERLNSEDIVYTTAHTPFTLRDTVYAHSSTAPIDATGWNVYGLAHYRDSLVWSVNGVDTYTYSRMADGPEDQWPFDRKFYLILSIQLSGAWVGPLCTEDLPTTMDIDWIRFRKFEE